MDYHSPFNHSFSVYHGVMMYAGSLESTKKRKWLEALLEVQKPLDYVAHEYFKAIDVYPHQIDSLSSKPKP